MILVKITNVESKGMNIAILGHFAEGREKCDGQTVKTRELKKGFEMYTDYTITTIDTYGWKKHPFALLKKVKGAFKQNEVLFMLPASNGVKVFARLFAHYNKKYHRKIYYDVIGGWLINVLKSKGLTKSIASFDGVLVETQSMAHELEPLLNNIYVIPNFKSIDIVQVDKSEIYHSEGKKLCTFSRVIEEKGITDAINAVVALHEQYGVTLDIYGPVGEEYKEKFDSLLAGHSGVVAYKGTANPTQNIQLLSGYYALLFPTLYKTEGLPGTILDAFFAGLPIVASEWNQYAP